MKGIKIKGFSNYWIFPELGKVWSIKRNKWIEHIKKDGYCTVSLYSDDNKEWKTSVHRVICTAVYGEIPEGMVINHRDENPSNNAIWNLEVCTTAYNNAYGTRTERTCKKVERCDLQGNVLERYASTMEAERQGYNHSVVCLCCNNSYGKLRNVYKGNLFRYVI